MDLIKKKKIKEILKTLEECIETQKIGMVSK